MSEHRVEVISNFAFVDLETTGIPFRENNTTKITELSISVVKSHHLGLENIPRVSNKLTLCCNPGEIISSEITEITGLSNELLKHQSPFSKDVINTISGFLNLHKKPICFVAHNGNEFDYLILRAEIGKLEGEFPKDILCVDSLLFFKDLHRRQEISESMAGVIPSLISTSEEDDSPDSKRAEIKKEIPIEFSDGFDELLCDAMDEYEESIKKRLIQNKNETAALKEIKSRDPEAYPTARKFCTVSGKPRSFKLVDIYHHLTKKTPDNCHCAEGDVETLIYCVHKYGKEFISWANENAIEF